MKQIEKVTSLLMSNPKLLATIGYGRLASRFGKVPRECVQKEIRGVKFEFDFSYGPQIRKMYFNTYDPLNVAAMKRFLKEGDTFLDVGANIGFLSAIAAGIVGKRGQVHSFEPVPRDFDKLKRLALLNPGYKVVCNPFALGEKKETADMDINRLSWVGWNTMVPNFMRRTDWSETIKVEVIRLDEYIRERKRELGRIAVIKIDTEGFEFFVLKGLENYFKENQDRPVIICEITPRANGLMGISLADLSKYMGQYNYRSYSLLDKKKEIDLTSLKKQTDIIFRAPH